MRFSLFLQKVFIAVVLRATATTTSTRTLSLYIVAGFFCTLGIIQLLSAFFLVRAESTQARQTYEKLPNTLMELGIKDLLLEDYEEDNEEEVDLVGGHNANDTQALVTSVYKNIE
jgi:hypothetical protein